MIQKKLNRVTYLFLTLSFLIHEMGSFAAAAWINSFPEEWVLGDRLLAGALFLIVIGWLTGAYALIFANVAPVFNRFFLYPLLKVIRPHGEKKPLITKK
jgi:hypothetical protein